jgi:hypothetical protein
MQLAMFFYMTHRKTLHPVLMIPERQLYAIEVEKHM